MEGALAKLILNRMGVKLKNMKAKNAIRLKTFLICHRVFLVLTIMLSHATETSPYLARRAGQFQVSFPATNHLGPSFTRVIQRRADTVGPRSIQPEPLLLINTSKHKTNKIGMLTSNDTPTTLNRLMTPPPPERNSPAASAGFTSFYPGSHFSNNKDQSRYAMGFHSGSSNTKSHFNKNSHIHHSLHKNSFDEKEEASKRYAMNYHTGADSTHRIDDLETSTSSSDIITDYTSSSPRTDTFDNNNNRNFLGQNTNFHTQELNTQIPNMQMTGKGFTGSGGSSLNTLSNHIGHPHTKHHLHNIKQQLLHSTGPSNNFHNHVHNNGKEHRDHFITGASSTSSLTGNSNLGGGGAHLTTSPNFHREVQFPTTSTATVGASIQFSQNSAQPQYQQHQPADLMQPINNQNNPNNNWQQQQQYNNNNVNNNNNYNQNYNENQQQPVNNQNFQQNQQNQQQGNNAYPTGFDPRSQSKLPWAHHRFPTQYRPSAPAPSGGSVPFAHHQLQQNQNVYNQQQSQGTTGASGPVISAVRPGQLLPFPVTQNPQITPTFGLGTTGSQYAAVRNPSQMPTEGRQERLVTQPSIIPPTPPTPAQQQTPPPPPKSTTGLTTTSFSTTTRKLEKIQDTTEPVASASEAASNFVESSTSRAGQGGYGWGPEGAQSGGGKDEDGGIANVFVDIVTSKIKSIQSTITGIQTAIKSAKRSSARKIANKIEGIGQFVNAVTKGVGGIFEAKANSLSPNKGWSKSGGGGGGGGGGKSGGCCGSGGNGGADDEYGSDGNGNFGSASGGNKRPGGGRGNGAGRGNGGGWSNGGNNGNGGGGNNGNSWGNGGSGNNGNSWGNGGGGNFGNSGSASGGGFGNGGGSFGGSGGYNNGGEFGGNGGSFGGSNGNFGGGGSGGFGSASGGNNFGGGTDYNNNGFGGYDNGGSGFGNNAGGGFDNNNNLGSGADFGVGFGNNGGGNSNIPQSANSGASFNAGSGGSGTVQGGVVSIGNPNPFEGATGGYSWTQG